MHNAIVAASISDATTSIVWEAFNTSGGFLEISVRKPSQSDLYLSDMYLRWKSRHPLRDHAPTCIVQHLGYCVPGCFIPFQFNDYKVAISVKAQDINKSIVNSGDLSTYKEILI